MRLAQDGQGSGGEPTAFLLIQFLAGFRVWFSLIQKYSRAPLPVIPGEIVKKPLYKKSPSAATAKAKNSELKHCNIGSRKHAVHLAHSSPA